MGGQVTGVQLKERAQLLVFQSMKKSEGFKYEGQKIEREVQEGGRSTSKESHNKVWRPTL